MPQIVLTKPFISQNGVKNRFLDLGVTLNSIFSGTALIDAIRTNKLKLCPNVKLFVLDYTLNSLN